MSFRLLLSAVLLVLPALPSANAQSPDTAADEAVLRHFKTVEWPRAYRERDTAALDRMLADDFVVYTGDGPSTKAEEIAWLRDNEWKNDGFHYTIQRLSLYGDTALIVGEGVIRFATGNNPRLVRYTSSNVLVKRHGQWRAVSSHVGGSRDEALP